MNVNDLPGAALPTQHHRLGGDPINRLVLVGSGRPAFGGDPGDIADRFARASRDRAGHGLGKGRVRSQVV